MNITKWTEKELKKHNAHKTLYDRCVKHCLEKGIYDTESIIRTLIKNGSSGSLDDASWFLSETLELKDCIRYAIFTAELCIDVYEKNYPDDNRPRKAIEFAKQFLKYGHSQDRAYTRFSYAAYASTETLVDAHNKSDKKLFTSHHATKAAMTAVYLCTDDTEENKRYLTYYINHYENYSPKEILVKSFEYGISLLLNEGKK